MGSRLSLFLILVTLSAPAVPAAMVDDFSTGGWTRFNSTPGTLSVGPGKLHLVDAPESPDWVTASKTIEVDLDQTPLFLVQVSSLSDRGTVKLIRQDPRDKRVALEIDRPGLYAIDMRQRFGWQGKTDVEVCLYAIGAEEEITYGFVKFTDALSAQEQQLLENRSAGGNVKLQVQPFERVPLFHTCSYYFQSPPQPGLAVHYRRQDASWHNAYEPVYVKEDGMFRGSLVNLDEDTAYELKITDAGGTVLAQGSFRTWCSHVPVKKTIVLDEETFSGNLTVTESGSPEGWIRITAREGFVLRNDRSGPLIDLDHVGYVLLEGLTLRGGLKEAIRIRKCQHIRVVNCDIAGWGRIGTQRFDLDGKYYTAEGRAINWDSAILVSKSHGTVVERCYIHDPVNRANSWYYSHPSGPQAVGMDKSPSTVLRYNDFVGSDEHRWNDAVEGAGNFHLDGGFHRDGDVYGNFICFANDDALEIDGGQTNVRVFRNKFEGCLCAVSIQGCMSGPSYVFENLLVNMGDDRGRAGQTIKTSSHANGPGAVSFLFHNTCSGDSSDLSLRHNLRIVARNNIFAGRSAVSGRTRSPQSDCDYNLLSTGEPDDEAHSIIGRPDFVDADSGRFTLRPSSPGVGQGTLLDNFNRSENEPPDMGALPHDSERTLPLRPVPVALTRHQVNFSPADLVSGRTRSVSVTVQDDTPASPYRIARNEAFDWFEVTPQAGMLTPGRTLSFQITLRPENLPARPFIRGAFLIWLASGFSLPVTVYAQSDMPPIVKPVFDRESWVSFIEAESTRSRHYEIRPEPAASGGACITLSGPARKNPLSYPFRVPETGKVFVLFRIKSAEPVRDHDSIFFGIDDGPIDWAQLYSDSQWTWSLAAHNRAMSLICLQAFDLSAGEHVLRLAPSDSLSVDLIAVTDNPGLFDTHWLE